MFDSGLFALVLVGCFPLLAVRHKGQTQEFAAAYALLLCNLIDAFEQIIRQHDIYARHKLLSFFLFPFA